MVNLYRNPLGGCLASILAVADVVILLGYHMGRINGKIPNVDGCMYFLGGAMFLGLTAYALYGFSRNPNIIDGEFREHDVHIDKRV